MSFLASKSFKPSAVQPTSPAEHLNATPDTDFNLSDVECIDNFGLDNSEDAQKCRHIMSIYNRLVDLGADKFLEIPQIVVIGGQSAGKSSLVEAVSKIKVPRDSGTCTRCAMQFTLVREPDIDLPWSCKIMLRYEYDSNGQPLNTSRTEDFVTLVREQDVEINLRRAQLAILSVSYTKDVAKFKDMSSDQLTWYYEQHKNVVSSFSKNTVVVTISAPGVTELTFVDLPGLVSNASDEDIKTVTELVESKINRPKTIILVAIPMSEDMRRQEAVKMARKADPDGKRTIGVLTKPDALREGDFGSREDYKKVILGQDEQLTHGYFCVRLRNDEERKQNRDISVLSRELFTGDTYWKAMRKADRFGIDNLVKYVSPLLVKLFEESLPDMRKRVVQLITQTRKELDNLGEEPDLNRALEEVNMLILQFGLSVNDLVFGNGSKGNKAVVQANRRFYTELRNEVLKTCPRFDSTAGMPNLSALTGAQGDVATYLNSSEMTITQVDVKRLIEENTSWELPGEVPLEATRDFIEQFTRKWAPLVRTCFENVFDNSLNSIIGIASSGFRPGKRNVSALEHEVRRVINSEMSTIKSKVLVIVDKIISWENPKVPYTLSPEYTSVRDNILNHFKNHRSNNTIPDVELDVMAKVLAYFQVAYKRLIDTIPRAIEQEIHGHLHENLTKALFSSIAETERAKELLKEDKSVGRKRKNLAGRLERLKEIRAQLQVFAPDLETPRTPSPLEGLVHKPEGTSSKGKAKK